MSGIFGIADSRRQLELDPLTRQMAQTMTYRPWFVVEQHTDETAGISLGRMGIGIFNKGPQPIHNAAGDVTLFMAGEFYNTEALSRQPGTSDEQFALQLYETLGVEFAARLNGAFIIAIWDRPRRKLILANDRFGFYRLFYACHAGRLVFAPEMKGVLCDPGFTRKLDDVALAQTMRFQHLFGERTFFEGLNFLPNASTLTFDLQTADLRIQRYWSYANLPNHMDIGFDEAVEEATRLMGNAVHRFTEDSYRPGVFLSGGLDARSIVGFVRHRPVATLTFGAKNCRDVYYAGQIAKAVGSDHHWVDISTPGWVLDNLDLHLNLTEGLHSWVHMHGLNAMPLARQLMDVNLTGWDGGTVMGHPESLEPLQYAPCDEIAFLIREFYLFTQKWTWPSVTEAEERLLYTPQTWKRLDGLAHESFRQALSGFHDLHPEVRSDLFFIDTHCARLTQNMVTFGRAFIEYRFPFFDYEFFDFMLSLPVRVRGGRRLYRALIQKAMPKLAYIPYDHDELLPTTNRLIYGSHAWVKRIQRAVNLYIAPIFPKRSTLYADYENYLRGGLRSWAESILYDPRLAERGIFNPEFIHSLVCRHMAGQEEWLIGKIAPIITYEMMLRRLYD